MSAEKAQIDVVEDASSVTRDANEAQSVTFDNLSEAEYNALEKKRKLPVLANLARQH